MIIEIDVAVAHDRESLRSLERIALKIEDGWHLWAVDEPEDFEGTPWLRDPGVTGERGRALLLAAIKRSGYPPGIHSRRVRVALRPQQADGLEPKDAADLAESPVVILVENRFADGAFVRRIIADLDRVLNKYWQDDIHRVEIDSVGGKGQMADEVERRCKRGIRPRLVVVVDSDQRAPSVRDHSPTTSGPGTTPSLEAARLKRKCDQYQVPCWVLAKREAENFLPRVLLEARPNADAEHQRRVDAWGALDEDQKDFYDMKDGFPKEPTPAEGELFGNLAKRRQMILESGFGPNIDKCWEIWEVSAGDALRERGRGDLEKGLELLRSEV